MTPDELPQRTKAFALRIIRLVDSLPRTLAGRAVGGQLVRSGPAVGANYRAARRVRSRREFTAKLGVVVEEADECEYWLDLIGAAALLPLAQISPLQTEAGELCRIFAAMRRTARDRE